MRDPKAIYDELFKRTRIIEGLIRKNVNSLMLVVRLRNLPLTYTACCISAMFRLSMNVTGMLIGVPVNLCIIFFTDDA